MPSNVRAPLAVVGMACRYPGAANLEEFWNNVLGRRVQFRDIPECRLSAEYIDPDPTAPDKTYGKRAAVMDGFRFDPLARRVPKRTAEGTDVVHWLSLEVALAAVEDAKLDLTGDAARKQIGVVLGNTLTGEETRSNTLRTRWPFVRRALHAAAEEEGMSRDVLSALERRMEGVYKSAFPPVTEDTLAGGLSNTIAGRICNYLDLGGGAFTIDGACSSSLLAVTVAGDMLRNGRADVMLVGGVDVSLDPFELVGFAKATALSKDEMRVYDQRGAGFIPGEGCGFVVLKRLADAERDGDRVYATVEGWGISTDGKGALTAPTIAGQALALQRAYEMAGYAPSSLSFVEGHGTGTKVGDRIELCAISDAARHFSTDVQKSSIGVTSLKSIVGHAKAAAGIGGFIKTVMAASRRIAPPMAGCERPHEVFEAEAAPLYPLRFGKTLDVDAQTRAGVSAMGFGGINCHVTVQSIGAAPAAAVRARDERELASWQAVEIFPFAGKDREAVAAQADELLALAKGISVAELADLSVHWTARVADASNGPTRAAVVAGTPDDLAARLRALATAARASTTTADAKTSHDVGKHIWLSTTSRPSSVAFVFSGQGSQRSELGLDMFLRFPWARSLFQTADRIMAEMAPDLRLPFTKLLFEGGARELDRTEIAQPAICLVSMLWFRLLERVGVTPDAVGGHSLGELTALWAAGAYSDATLLRLAAWRGRAMAADPTEPAGMIALFCSAAEADALTQSADGYAVVANYNGPGQQVVAGTKAVLASIARAAKERKIRAVDLPVSNAFHSTLVEGASRVLATLDFLPERASLTLPFHSGYEAGAIYRDVPVRAYLAEQVVRPVHFEPTIRGLATAADRIVEVGPGQILSGLSSQSGVSCLPVAADGSRASLAAVVADAWSRGVEIAWSELYATRASRPFVPAAERNFYRNPCERLAGNAPLPVHVPAARADARVDAAAQANAVTDAVASAAVTDEAVYERIALLIAEQTGFPPESLHRDLLLLDNLNLDSIKSMALLDDVGRAFGIRGKLAPGQLAKRSIGDLADAVIAARKNAEDDNADAPRDGGWTESFVLDFVPCEEAATSAGPLGSARILADRGDDGIASAIKATFDQSSSSDAAPETLIVVVPLGTRDMAASRAKTMHALADFGAQWRALGEAGRAKCARIVFVQRTDGQLGRSGSPEAASVNVAAFAASVSLDEPTTRVLVVDLPHAIAANQAAEIVAREIRALAPDAASHRPVVSIDAQGRRRVPVLRHTPPPIDAAAPSWSAEDVVVVTGGGKGITAECALAFAQATNARLAILGRSAAPASPDDKSELAETLARYEKEGARAFYFPCDVGDAAALTKTLAEVERTLGQITGVIHGAGMNKARRVEEVSYEEACAETAPKVQGAANLCAYLGDRPLKLFAALTSVIGVAGMVKNAWYAFANEQVDNLLRAYQTSHPAAHVVCLAYSAWDEVGMGAKMGSLSFLADVGMSAIPIEQGVTQFMAWTTRRAADVQIVVTGRMGNLPTWRALRPVTLAPRANRFAQQIVSLEPDVEVVVRGTLRVETHPFLRDHDFHGSMLFPTVMGLEAMAEAVRLVSGRADLMPLRIAGLELERPILVGPRGTTIEIQARRSSSEPGEEAYLVRIVTEETDFETPHFHGELRLGPVRFERDERPQATSKLPLSPKKDLYGRFLFQGALFQQLEAMYSLDGQECTFGLMSHRAEDGEASFLLGDPYARDVLLQTMQLVVSPEEALPIRVRSWRLATPLCGGHATAHSVLHTRDGDIRGANVTAWGEDHTIVEQLVGYESKVLRERADWPTANVLAAGPSATTAAHEAQQGPAAIATTAMYGLLPSADVDQNGPDGQIELRMTDMTSMRHAASASRHANHTYFIDWMGRLREASLLPVRHELARDLMGGKWGLVTNSTTLVCERPVAAGDIINASIFMRRRDGKYGGTMYFGYEWTRIEDNARVRVARGWMDATWVAIVGHGHVEPEIVPPYFDDFVNRMMPPPGRVPSVEEIRTMRVRGDAAGGDGVDESLGVSIWTAPREMLLGPTIDEHVIRTGQAHSNLVGNVYFANYSAWQVAAMDAMLQKRLPNLFGGWSPPSGELRCGRAVVRHLREAMPFDTVAVTLHLQEIATNGIKLQFEFWRVDGSDRTKLAAGEVVGLWSEAAADGTWRVGALPADLRTSLLDQAREIERPGARDPSGSAARTVAAQTTET